MESNRHARVVLEENLDALGLRDRSAIWPLSLPKGLERLRERISAADVVLLDPPYGGDDARALLAALGGMTLRPGVRVVLEHHARDEVPEHCGSLKRVRERSYGETRVSTYTRDEATDGPGGFEESV